MPIKNYTTKMPVSQSLAKIQQNLVDHGATGFMVEYEKGTGRIEALKFLLDINDNRLSFNLPVDWRAFQEVLKKDNVRRWDEDDYCYRVAWANLRDWVDSQMALFETRMVSLPQIFLPYVETKDGTTLFQKMANNPKLLLE